MAKQRSDFQTVLESIPGVEKVYFQPPESVKLVYPCILYEYSYELNDAFICICYDFHECCQCKTNC